MENKTIKSLSPYGNSIEELDMLEKIIEANSELSFKDSKVTADHQSSKTLLSSFGNSFFGNSTHFHQIIKECIHVYYSTPTIRNIIDLMTDFACEGISITHKDPASQILFQNWAKKTNFYGTIRNIIHTILLTGNMIAVRQTGKISLRTQRMLTKAFLEEENVKLRHIPVGYTILDPLLVEIETSSLFGDRVIYYNISQQDVERIRNPKTASDKEYVASLSKEFKDQALSNKKITLDRDKIITLFYKKLEWQNWAFPLIFSALDDVNFKKMLRQMDESSAADVIKAIVVFKLGAIKEGFPPDAARFQKFARLLKDPSGSKNIVWDDLIDIKDSFPPIEKILGSAKYEVVDRDILSNFGVSQILVNGGAAGNFSTGFLSVRALQEKLESVREDVMNNFIEPELKSLSMALEIEEPPVARFSSMSLRDENAEKKLMIDLMDRKVLSSQSVLETFEFSPDIESIRLKRQDKSFPDVISPLENTGTGPTDGGNGRPKLTKKKQTTKRKTKPKGLGGLYTRCFKRLADIWCTNNNTTVLGDEIINISNAALLAIDSINPELPLSDESIQIAINKTISTLGNNKTLYEKLKNKIPSEIYDYFGDVNE